MKKFCLSVLLIVFTINVAIAQKIVQNDLYTVVYSEELQQPISLSYEVPDWSITSYPAETVMFLSLSVDGIITDVSYPDPDVITKIFKEPNNIVTSNEDDYVSNVYDHGHLAPKKTFELFEVDRYLYSYLNCALMHETLNSGVWRVLEEYVRDLNKIVSVNVFVSFSDESKQVKGGATIPSGFTKVLKYFNNDGEKVVEVYIFPNDATVKGKKIDEFKIN